MIVKTIYKVIRSIIFSVTLFVVGIYILAYILLSIPAFTNVVKNRTANELIHLIGGKVEIEDLSIYPFNEVKMQGIEVYDLDSKKCLEIETLGAGVSLWKLITEGKIEISYAEILGMSVNISQNKPDSALNIQFIIDAFSKKDENKEDKAFELALRNVVLRKSSATFRRPWLENKKIGLIDLSDLKISDLAADITFPKINNKSVIVDLRRLSFAIPGVTLVDKIGLKGEFSENGLSVKDFVIELPATRIFLPSVDIPVEPGENISASLAKHGLNIQITDSYVTPSEFACLFEPLKNINDPLALECQFQSNMQSIDMANFRLGNSDVLLVQFRGGMEDINDKEFTKGFLSDLNVEVSSNLIKKVLPYIPGLSSEISNAILKAGNITVSGDLAGKKKGNVLTGNIEIDSELCKVTAIGELQNISPNSLDGNIEVILENANIQEIFPKVKLNDVNANIIADVNHRKENSEGSISLVVENFKYKGLNYDGLSINLSKYDNIIEGDLMMHNKICDVEANFKADIEGTQKTADMNIDLQRFDPSEIIDMHKYKNYLLSGNITMEGEGENIDDITGNLVLSNFSFYLPDSSKNLKLKRMEILAESDEDYRNINLKSDWIDIRAEGNYKFKSLPDQIIHLAERVFPDVIDIKNDKDSIFLSDVDFDIVIKNNNSLTEFFNLPIRMLVPVNIGGSIEGINNKASLTLSVPYLQQGKDKLIYDTKVVASVDGADGVLDATIESTFPVKNGDLSVRVNLYGENNNLATDLYWINTENANFKGHLALETQIRKNRLTLKPEILVDVLPSVMKMGVADWNVSKSTISYTDKLIKIDGLKIWHDNQYVEIYGDASEEYADVMTVRLSDIDVDYVFAMLNINYVTFGGIATGEVFGHALLSGNPVAETESIEIKEFSYNGSKIGTCIAASRWNNEEKEIEITADISEKGKRRVYGSGGIWLGRDSLCFDIAADKVPVEFVQPFMSVFSSHVGGYATGNVKLFGNFHDIDMTGKIFADSVAVKLDYTNTVYHGSDSVILTPGKIEIPHFRLFDKFGNSALLTGELTHRYFHDPSFTFRLSEAQNFLCYDTSSELNPDWYGILYGTGSAFLKGVTGLVDISADMTVGYNSAFTFVLNETEYARDYQFLTFSDKKKEQEIIKSDSLTVDDFKQMLKKKMSQDENSLSKFGIDIRATVTPQTLFTLVMDPAAGDKITARGNGAMQIKYESDNDEMMMYGKYEIEEGNYNFSLQDIILRDFKIKEGSYISFNGNPLRADLDISATYRVNTNLSDLDKSFSTDRDLNRTNVPVDAVLSVDGNMQQPDITFDIELPTLTQDVERKVKSIISTDDMMNRQIIYLLALNRFYTPEYMGTTSNGGELAAVASSTISSQLSNILGQLTDKFSVSPSFRSDKGDFSDIEVDVVLSSRLLNNRLLINGNFGYRDRSNSSTTFIGDFDVEYLLSKNGNLRLKAYNHFNDQNYYLREALTTQGLGVVYRRDFDNWFTFLKKRKKTEKTVEENLEERPDLNNDKRVGEEIENTENGTKD